MFCKNCGNLLKDNSVFCLECGYKTENGTKFCKHCNNEVNGADLCLQCGRVNYSVRRPATVLKCNACGTVMMQKGRFCPSCGDDITNQKDYCPVCSVEVSKDADVCLKCGHLINPFVGNKAPVVSGTANTSVKTNNPTRKASSKFEFNDDEKLFYLGKKITIAGFLAMIFTFIIRLFSPIFAFLIFDAETKKNLPSLDAYFDQQPVVKTLISIFEAPAFGIIFFLSALALLAGFTLMIISKRTNNKIYNIIKLSVLFTLVGLSALFIILSTFIAVKGLYVCVLVFLLMFILAALGDNIFSFILKKDKNIPLTVVNYVAVGFAISILFVFIITNMNYLVWYKTIEIAAKSLGESMDYINTSLFGPSAYLTEMIESSIYSLKEYDGYTISQIKEMCSIAGTPYLRISTVLVSQILAFLAIGFGMVMTILARPSEENN